MSVSLSYVCVTRLEIISVLTLPVIIMLHLFGVLSLALYIF